MASAFEDIMSKDTITIFEVCTNLRMKNSKEINFKLISFLFSIRVTVQLINRF